MAERVRSFRVEAVVLRHSEWGEADRIVTLFTREMGKLRALAKGVRKIRSRKAGHLEPFTHVSLQLASGRDLPIITQAETLQPFLALRDGMLLPSYASYVVELMDKFTYEEGENRGLYRLLTETLQRLANGDPPDLVVRYYEMRLLDLVGFRPHLFQCSLCGGEIHAEDQYFSAEQGGVICPACASRPTSTALLLLRPVSMTALKYLRHLQRSAYADAQRALISPAVTREMEMLMQHYLTYVLERGLNTPAFLRRARHTDELEEAIPPDEPQTDGVRETDSEP